MGDTASLFPGQISLLIVTARRSLGTYRSQAAGPPTSRTRKPRQHLRVL